MLAGETSDSFCSPPGGATWAPESFSSQTRSLEKERRHRKPLFIVSTASSPAALITVNPPVSRPHCLMTNSHFGEGNKRRMQVEGSRLRIVPETRDLPYKSLLFCGTVKKKAARSSARAPRGCPTARTCQTYKFKPAFRSVLVKLADGLLNCAKLFSTLKGPLKSPKTLRNFSHFFVMMCICNPTWQVLQGKWMCHTRRKQCCRKCMGKVW